MILDIPIKTNFYNFDFFTSINQSDWWIKFLWQKRQNIYYIDIGYSPTYPLAQGIPAIVNVQINKSFLHHLPGSLFLYTEDRSISNPNYEQLGTQVKLVYYLP